VIEGSAAFGELKTSMLQDVEKGRPLEADALNGAVVRLGRVHGVPTPVNDTLLGCAQLLSDTNARPG
jgi:2-dehydropantoate 2-reductase